MGYHSLFEWVLSGLWLVMIKRTLGVESTAPLFGDEAAFVRPGALFNTNHQPFYLAAAYMKINRFVMLRYHHL
jgi:hypothetical protein